MKTTQERMGLLKYFLQDSLGEIPSWYHRFTKGSDNNRNKRYKLNPFKDEN